MIRFLLPAVMLLAACAGPIPDSGAGAGFDTYDRHARDAELSRSPIYIDPVTGDQTSTAQSRSLTPEQQTASDALAAIREPGVIRTPAGRTAIANSNNTPSVNRAGISDEQDFSAVSSRQTIESDAQRRQRQSAQYQLVAPEPLPVRPSSSAPTPIEFALSTRHPVGEQRYRRGLFGGAANAGRNCAGFPSSEAAQDAFLQAGGPQRDKLGLDPDGDGYACRWNPQTYRGVARN